MQYLTERESQFFKEFGELLERYSAELTTIKLADEDWMSVTLDFPDTRPSVFFAFSYFSKLGFKVNKISSAGVSTKDGEYCVDRHSEKVEAIRQMQLEKQLREGLGRFKGTLDEPAEEELN